jgi:hypothetical protein
MKLSVTIKGGEKLQRALAAIDSAAVKMAEIGLERAVIRIHEEAVKSIQEHRSSGKKYGRHTASAPGSPPNTDTGALVRAIDWQVDRVNLVASVGLNPSKAKAGPSGVSPMEYGPALEFGTSKIKPRPWLGPAYRVVKKEILGFFQLKVKKGA